MDLKDEENVVQKIRTLCAGIIVGTGWRAAPSSRQNGSVLELLWRSKYLQHRHGVEEPGLGVRKSYICLVGC